MDKLIVWGLMGVDEKVSFLVNNIIGARGYFGDFENFCNFFWDMSHNVIYPDKNCASIYVISRQNLFFLAMPCYSIE